MNCNCSVANVILALVVIVFALWITPVSQWLVVIAGVLILIHSLMHKHTSSDRPKAKKR